MLIVFKNCFYSFSIGKVLFNNFSQNLFSIFVGNLSNNLIDVCTASSFKRDLKTICHTCKILKIGISRNNLCSQHCSIFTISKRPVEITANDQNKLWGEDDPDLTATVTGAVEGDTIDYTVERIEGEAAETRAEGDDGDYIGTYEIRVVAGDNPNYEITTTAGTMTITKKPVTIVSSLAEARRNGETIYSGTIVELTAEMPNLTENSLDRYSIQWQAGDMEDGSDMVNIDGETGITYSYILNSSNIGKYYRVVVTLIDKPSEETNE